MPALGENPRTHDPPMTNGWLNSYDQALDLGQSQQNSLQKQQQAAQAAAAAAQHKAQHTTIKHEQIDHSRWSVSQASDTVIIIFARIFSFQIFNNLPPCHGMR